MKIQEKRNPLFSAFILLSVLYSLILVTDVKPASATVSQTNFFYYSRGRKIELPLSKETVLVRFKPKVTFDEQRAVVESQGDFSSFSERKELPVFKLTLLPLSDEAIEKNIIQTINFLGEFKGSENLKGQTPFSPFWFGGGQ
jgi:hypothetical protein